MNDPCAPGYDATTGTYRLFYQWNPHSVNWGDISWGALVSKDLVHWQYTCEDAGLMGFICTEFARLSAPAFEC